MDPTVHAGLITVYDRGAWNGVLIQGSSGVGKSDLALRAVQAGFRLVSDDRTRLWTAQGRLYGACPEAIAGLMEARGVGITPQPTRPFTKICLIVRCLGANKAIERLPDPAQETLLGVALPMISLHPLEASAPQKLSVALSLLGGGR